jgi:hypothetical protein
MESRLETLATIERLLKGVLDGQLDAKTAISRWPNIDDEKDKMIQSAWHELYHYWIDEDLRAKDPAYGEDQRERLRWYLKEMEHLR